MAFLTGWSKGQLVYQDEYELNPVIVRFSFDLNAVLARYDWRWPGEWRFNVEPYFAQSWSPDQEQEFGCGLFLRWLCPLDGRVSLFIEGGAGPMYMTLDSAEQSTHFNFIDQAGVGLIVKVSEACDAELGCRFRHVSNAGIDNPNSGIESTGVLFGVSYRY